MTSTEMPLGLRQCWTAIKGSPSLCALIHFSHLLLLQNQVSGKPLLLLLLLLQDQLFPGCRSQLTWAVIAQGWELLVLGEGRGEKVLCRQREAGTWLRWLRDFELGSAMWASRC